MKVQVKDKQGRVVNPHYLFKDTEDENLHEAVSNLRFNKFEQSVKTYPAPGITDGTHECELKDKDDWGVKKGNDYYSYDTRQIWVLAEQEKEGKTAEEVFNDYINIRTVGNEVAQNIIDAMVTYAAQFKDTTSSTRIAELQARVAELEGVLKEINRTTAVIAISPPTKVEHIKALATNALKKQQP